MALLAFLAVELLDETVYGAREAAWPLIRTDLGLSYVHIGVLLSVPAIVSHLIEPVIGILGDVWDRRRLILGGGLVFGVALAAVAVSPGMLALAAALMLLYPASGAFVNLSQASLMDSDPARREQNMVRWTFAGYVGVVIGAVVLALAVTVGLGWRGLFLVFFPATLLVVALVRKAPVGTPQQLTPHATLPDFRRGIAEAFRALRRPAVLRWLVLLEFSDLMLDGLFGYLSLYFVDVVGISEANAALSVAVWTAAGLLGSLLLIPAIERVPGLVYLRVSALADLMLFPVFLLAPGLWAKLPVLAALGSVNSGWYSVIQAQVYAAMPGRSGSVLAVENASGLVGSLVPLGLGVAARAWGLGGMLWLLLAGPIVLLVGTPRSESRPARPDASC